ncbi:MAG: hypothetical protein HKN57_06075 [Xanthomonadales bacterium]|nr:hypothetical protein [Gammaproteobacteria bacterium]MBT8052679.1 hypothetical protein [Gammaproteobacteria bacterium]NND56800.1 hypothetical protein [Xanthomonadales bacterium]NNK50663.1 hypothetical protein [Xanthomonadales bacterium]
MNRAVSRIVCPFAVLCIAAPLTAANERIAGFSADDTITIRSAEARMDEQSDIIHFGGSFEIRANDFYLLSEQASLYGKLDDPETIVVTGSPATISVNTVTDGRTSTIYGQAARIVYQRDANSIRMEGAASLSRDGHTMSGSEMEYDVETDYLRAGGDGGVHIRIRPDGS